MRGGFVSLCPIHEWFLEGRAFDPCEGIQNLETPDGVENLLDHLRTHFEPVEVFKRGRIVDTILSVSQVRKSGITTR